MSDVVLDIANLTIGLPPGADRAAAVQGMNLVLRAGEVTCLVGESGSGKSLAARSILVISQSVSESKKSTGVFFCRW
jgi:peptide/nickel transport system ATP-binding protein